MLRMRMASLVLLLLGFGLYAPFVKADDELLKEYHRMFNAYLCTDTFFNCAAVSRAECDQLVDDSISACPTATLTRALLFATDSEEAEDVVLDEAKTYGLCYSANLQRIAQERKISEDCIQEAVIESASNEKEKARAWLESRRKESSR